MGQRDELLAAMRARLDRVADTADATEVLDTTALAEAQLLARYGTDGDIDLDAAYALGWFHYYRALVLPPAEAEEEGRTAADFFAPCFIAGADNVPLPLLPTIVSRAVLHDFGTALHPDMDPDHLTSAVSLWRRIAGIMPDTHPDKPGYLNNLGFALRMRFQRIGELEDLDEAIKVGRTALAAMRRDDLRNRAMCLMNVGAALQLRSEQISQTADLDEIVDVHTIFRALAHSHPDLGISPTSTTDLDRLVEAVRKLRALDSMQSERARSATDLADLAEVRKGALDRLAGVHEHPDLAVSLTRLNKALSEQLLQTGEPPNLEEAAESIRALLRAGAGVGAELPEYAGRYRLEGRLGSWDRGVVHLARSASGQRLAVKVVHADLARDAEFRRQFRQQVAAARRVSGAFTAPIVDADPEAERPWLATLFIPGPTLSDHVKRNGPMPPAQLPQLMAGLTEALRDMHRVGVVHRDLKPSNVLLANGGPKLLDFGLSLPSGAELRTNTGALTGTPPFMAPEQFRGEAGPAADIFALGSVMVHAATGRGPFDADSPYVVAYQVVHEEPDLTGVPESLTPLIMRCLAKAAEDRPTPDELIRELGLALPGQWAPPRCEVHLVLLDDDPRVGTYARLALELVADSEHPWANPAERPSLDIVAVPMSSAEIVPATVLYKPGNSGAAQFRVTAREAGTHRIRFTLLHHDTGLALQQVETELDITDPEPTRARKRPLRPRTGRS